MQERRPRGTSQNRLVSLTTAHKNQLHVYYTTIYCVCQMVISICCGNLLVFYIYKVPPAAAKIYIICIEVENNLRYIYVISLIFTNVIYSSQNSH